MRQRLHFLEILYCHLLLVFLAGRLAFICYNRHIEALSFIDIVGACHAGLLSHDVAVAALLLLPAAVLAYVHERAARGAQCAHDARGVWNLCTALKAEMGL